MAQTYLLEIIHGLVRRGIRQRQDGLLDEVRGPRLPHLALDVDIVSLNQGVPRHLPGRGLPAHGLGLLEEVGGQLGVDVDEEVLRPDLHAEVLVGTVAVGAVYWPVVRHCERGLSKGGGARV